MYLYRILLILLISFAPLILSPAIWAATYYIDATYGLDSNSGLSTSSPWKTLAKVNSSSFNPGDFIKLRRGRTWREELIIPSSGNANNPITFSAYGSGNNPIIHGSNSRQKNIYILKKDYIVIQNMTLRYSNLFGVYSWSSNNIIIEDLVVEYAKRSNIYIGDSDNITVRRCVLRYAQDEHGIYLDGAATNGTDYPIVEYCDIYGNNWSGIKLNFGKGYQVRYPILRYNTIHDNGHAGIDDYSSYGGKYYFNLIYDNEGPQILHSYDHTYDSNHNYTSENSKVYNNVIISPLHQSGTEIDNYSTGHIYRNNIFYGRNNTAWLIEIKPNGSANFNYNSYYSSDFYGLWIFKNRKYSSLSAWQNATGFDSRSIASNPQFMNINDFNFSLKETSPCIDAGVDVGLDFDLNDTPLPSGSKFDIGAYEYIGQNTISPPLNLKIIFSNN